jgi:dihydroxyacid dehydratase/phosphogluconate dehydratase
VHRGPPIPGDPACLALVVISALLGLVSISTEGKFKGVSLDRLRRHEAAVGGPLAFVQTADIIELDVEAGLPSSARTLVRAQSFPGI